MLYFITTWSDPTQRYLPPEGTSQRPSLRYSGAVLPLKLCSERLLEAARIIKEAAEEQEQSTEAFSRLQVTHNRLQKSRRTSRDQQGPDIKPQGRTLDIKPSAQVPRTGSDQTSSTSKVGFVCIIIIVKFNLVFSHFGSIYKVEEKWLQI